jgi:hypothetical protein
VFAIRFASSVIKWLRSGYPEGVPEHGYLPLFALLASTLTTEQLDDVAVLLDDAAPIASTAAIRAAIATITDDVVHDVDVANVRCHIQSAGLPPADHEPTAAERAA